MRLIDADELKKAYEELTSKKFCGYRDFEKLIDNAPTVDCVPTEFHEKVLDETVGELLACQANLRPQGKWKLHGMIWYCSNCGKDCEQGGNNFCGQCGADMRGKDDQLRDCENCVHHSENGCEVWECEFKRRSS